MVNPRSDCGGLLYMEGNVQIDGLVKQRQELEQLMMSNPAMEKRVQGLIRKVLLEARRTISNKAKTDIKADPRQAYKAVKTAVYKRILGGSVSILNKKRAGATSLYEPPRTLQPGQRGGNRRSRSMRTEQVMSYQGADRGFILRFLNQGTDDRAIHSMGNRNLSRGGISILKTKSIGANRGSITARNWFGNASHAELEKVAGNLDQIIDNIIQGILY